MAAPSFDELHDLGKAEAIAKRPRLGIRAGDISDILISAAAAMADRLVGWFAERIAASFLDGAVGDDLTTLAADRYGIQRRAALKSTGQITVTRANADASLRTLAIGTVVATARDSRGAEVRFLTTSAASWAISTNGDRTVNVEAEIAGVEGTLADEDLITRMISSPPAGGTYTITSSTQPAGGSDEESDSDLRDRVKRYPSTLRRGTLYALEYGALSTPNAGVSKANAVQDTSGLVTVYISDASGASSGSTQAVDPDLIDDGLMTTRVAIELLNWACAGSLVNVTGGTLETVNIEVAVTVRLGVDVNQLISDIESAIEARVNRLTIGDTLYKSDIINAAKAVDPDNIVNVAVVLPLVDTAPTTAGNIIRAGTITVS
jgi:uncharacterized phage protein gp47/JayE